MKIWLLALLLIVSLGVRAQVIPASGPTIASFIPKGYFQLPQGLTYGDLTHDELQDVVLVVAPLNEGTRPTATRPPRLLLMLCGTLTGYRLAAVAREAVACQDCGGFMADPFARVDIERSVLKITHMVDGAQRAIHTAKFRYQRGDFYQIGETYSLKREVDDCPAVPGRCPGEIYRDANLLTGAYEAVRVSDECEVLENRRGKRAVQPLRKLVDYQPQL